MSIAQSGYHEAALYNTFIFISVKYSLMNRALYTQNLYMTSADGRCCRVYLRWMTLRRSWTCWSRCTKQTGRRGRRRLVATTPRRCH